MVNSDDCITKNQNSPDRGFWTNSASINRILCNEERSALLAQHRLEEAGMHTLVDEVVSYIRATTHQKVPEKSTERVFVDIDLSILGRDEETYRRYALGIRKEYGEYSDEVYRAGRAAFMERFLSRKSLYHTRYFREKYERQARENIKEELGFLNGKKPLNQYFMA